MNNTVDRAWRFELTAAAIASDGELAGRGLTATATGRIAMVEGGHAVRQSILLLLATRPGERVMRPDYGCWLHRLAFAPNDASTAGLACHFIAEALRRWEPRVVVHRLDAGRDLHGTGGDSTLGIVLEYGVRHLGLDDRLALSYDLAGARLMPEVAIAIATGEIAS